MTRLAIPELLAPAGSLDAVRAALANGAADRPQRCGAGASDRYADPPTRCGSGRAGRRSGPIDPASRRRWPGMDVVIDRAALA